MKLEHKTPNFNKLPGGVDLTGPALDITLQGNPLEFNSSSRSTHYDFTEFYNVLSEADCNQIIALFEAQNIASNVSIQGRQDVIDEYSSGKGSVRTTGWSEHLANEIWKCLSRFSHAKSDIHADRYYPSDWHQGDISESWRPIGISPLLRYMRYEAGGQHYAHYDQGYIYDNPRYRTLKSVVIYLSSHTADEGGCTRFINDKQQNIPITRRNHLDWIREVQDDEVIECIKPRKGNILTFPHRLCHDVQKYTGSTPRIIIRADIIFEAI